MSKKFILYTAATIIALAGIACYVSTNSSKDVSAQLMEENIEVLSRSEMDPNKECDWFCKSDPNGECAVNSLIGVFIPCTYMRYKN